MSIDAGEFRRTLGHFATGVTVVTTQYQNELHGTTVSSFSSLSLDPPLVLVCLDLKTSIHDLIVASQIFGVNILAEHGETTSRHFARHAPDKFSTVPYDLGQLAVPLLGDALATLECRVVAHYAGGDHSIFIGEVVAINTAHASQARPLLFFRSKYSQLHGSPHPLANGATGTPTRVNHAPEVPALFNATALD